MAEEARISWGNGVALAGCERELRELREQLKSTTNLLSDILIRVAVLEAQVSKESE